MNGPGRDVLADMSRAVERKRRERLKYCDSVAAYPCRVCGRPGLGKPACLDHLDILPDAAAAAAGQELREDEIRALNSGKRANPFCAIADDVMGWVPVTVGKISRIMEPLTYEGAERLARAMERAGRVQLIQRSRATEVHRAEPS